MDEPLAYSAGGNLVYWTHCCDRSAGAIDIAKTYPSLQEWTYFDYNIDNLVPGYSIMYNDWGGSHMAAQMVSIGVTATRMPRFLIKAGYNPPEQCDHRFGSSNTEQSPRSTFGKVVSISNT